MRVAHTIVLSINTARTSSPYTLTQDLCLQAQSSNSTNTCSKVNKRRGRRLNKSDILGKKNHLERKRRERDHSGTSLNELDQT